MRNPRILIVGNIYYDHLSRYVLHLKGVNGFSIDVFNVGVKNHPIPDAYKDVRVINQRNYFPCFFYKIKYLRSFCSRIDDMIAEKKIENKYDLMCVHYVSNYHICRNGGKHVAKRLMLTPWGSDVLRADNKKIEKLKPLFQNADYISFTTERTKLFLSNTFCIPTGRFVKLGFGSDSIDAIINHPEITKDIAKYKLGLENKYVITCGYNASPSQNHKCILDAIISVRLSLPEKLIVVLPMTYGGNKEYINSVYEYARENYLDVKLFDQYLSEEDNLLLRKCSDIFIHAQPTDGYSGSLQEYLLCGCQVINGRWTRYKELEQYEIPYHLFNDFNELEDTIKKVYQGKEIVLSENTIDIIRQKSWSAMEKGWKAFFTSIGN